MSNATLAWPKGHRTAVVVSVLLETWSEGKSPSYFPRTTPLPPGSKDIAGINWSQFGGNEGVWRLSRNLSDLGIPSTMFCNGRSAEVWPEAVAAFAKDLVHPRWLYALPNGDVLVAETNAPADRPEDAKGVKGFFYKQAQKRAGAGTPSPDRITLLRDKDGDGVAETRSVLIDKLHSPFGMALIGDTLYVANTDSVVAFPYVEGATKIDQPGKKIAGLPAGPINHHWTKGLVASPDGTKLYASVGSNSNAAENGLNAEAGRAAIHEIDLATGKSRIYASGLRNPVDMAFEPQTNALWAVVNERDELGSDLAPDYLTSVKDGGFYGWPFSYWGQHVDKRVPANQEMVAKAVVPDYALGNHVAPLGVAFAKNNNLLPENLRNGAFIGEHGSWNRKPFAGYKVVFVPFQNRIGLFGSSTNMFTCPATEVCTPPSSPPVSVPTSMPLSVSDPV